MNLADSVLEDSGKVAEALVLLLLIWRRVFRTLPIFCFYVAWGVVGDIIQTAATKRYPTQSLRIFVIGAIIDSLFQFGVLLELSDSVLKPVRKFLPRWTPVAVGLLICLVCAAIWPFAKSSVFSDFTVEERVLVHLQQTFSILRILFFLTLAAFSQLLSIGWRDRELQIATGLGFYSMASVAVSVLHTRPEFYSRYHLMDQLVVASYICSLLYWTYCFAQQEAERREFTPQMQNFLLAVAGTARSTRMTMNQAPRDRDRRE